MMRYRFAFAMGLVACCGIGGQAAAAPTDCEPARCAVQSALETECQCDLGVPGGTAAKTMNHGRYVSCVAHVLNDLAKDDAIPKNCKGRIRRCAARSTCGKPGAVTCLIPQLGECDLTAGTCVDNPDLPCTSDDQCVLGVRCKIKRSADLCMAKGGTVGTSPTCCSDCLVTP